MYSSLHQHTLLPVSSPKKPPCIAHLSRPALLTVLLLLCTSGCYFLLPVAHQLPAHPYTLAFFNQLTHLFPKTSYSPSSYVCVLHTLRRPQLMLKVISLVGDTPFLPVCHSFLSEISQCLFLFGRFLSGRFSSHCSCLWCEVVWGLGQG